MDIIGNIYEAVEDEGALDELPAAIAEEIGSRSCTLQIFSPEFELEGFWWNPFSQDMIEFYVEDELHEEDAWTRIDLTGSRLDRTQRHTDPLPIGQFSRTLFYNDFIRHFGDDAAYCLGFISDQPSGGHLVAGLQKVLGDEDFTDDQIAAYDQLRPHLIRMVELKRRLERMQRQAFCGTAAADCLADGYALIKANRELVYSNAAFERMLRRGDFVRVTSNKLYCADYVTDHRLRDAISSTLRFDGATPPAFVARDRDGRTRRFIASPKFVDGETLIAIWLNRDDLPASLGETVKKLYQLTDSELRVLLATSDGLSAPQIANECAASVATVRTHQQHIYQKTGTHKASELARLVATLPRLLP